jgi:hypothetical protein
VTVRSIAVDVERAGREREGGAGLLDHLHELEEDLLPDELERAPV